MIMGLFMVRVDRGVVIKYLGEGSGVKRACLIPSDGDSAHRTPLRGLPMAAALLKKGARTANVLAFLCAWAALSIPAELMELRFMGWKFMLARLGLTVGLIVPPAWPASSCTNASGKGSSVGPGVKAGNA